jgi:hypothetical protein
LSEAAVAPDGRFSTVDAGAGVSLVEAADGDGFFSAITAAGFGVVTAADVSIALTSVLDDLAMAAFDSVAVVCGTIVGGATVGTADSVLTAVAACDGLLGSMGTAMPTTEGDALVWT